jgi:uncharacterized protein YggU (UPF0235/DUF167 family)
MKGKLLRSQVDGVQFRLRVAPRGGRDIVEGWVRDAEGGMLLKARVAAAPENGKANVALSVLLAKTLDVPKKTVGIRSGAAARIKRVQICGDPAALSARLAKLGEAR